MTKKKKEKKKKKEEEARHRDKLQITRWLRTENCFLHEDFILYARDRYRTCNRLGALELRRSHAGPLNRARALQTMRDRDVQRGMSPGSTRAGAHSAQNHILYVTACFLWS